MIDPLYIDGPLKGGSWPVGDSALRTGISVSPSLGWDEDEQRYKHRRPAVGTIRYTFHRMPLSPNRQLIIGSVHGSPANLNWIALIDMMLSDRAKRALRTT